MENSDKPRVRVEHYRAGLFGGVDRYQRGRGFLINGQLIEKEPQERGGKTVASATLNVLLSSFTWPIIKHVSVASDGCTVSAMAVCSEVDAFCYRLGNKIAVGRLQKQLQLWGLEDAVAWP